MTVDSTRARIDRALDRSTPPEELTRLAGDDEASVRAAAALNPATPEATLLTLVRDSDDATAGNAAHNLSATRAVWEAAISCRGQALDAAAVTPWLDEDLATTLLADTEEEDVRTAVAGFTIWPSVLDQALTDPNPTIRAALAANPAAGESRWAVLARDKDKDVRTAVAYNAHVPAHLLTGFATDTSGDVRWATVSNNPHNRDLLALFLDDADEDIRAHARRHHDHPGTRTINDDGTVSFTYPHDGLDGDLPGVDHLIHPVTLEWMRQGVEREARRRSHLP